MSGLWECARYHLVDILDHEAAVEAALGPATVPLLLFHNPTNPIMPFSYAELLRAAAARAEVPVTLVPTPGWRRKRGLTRSWWGEKGGTRFSRRERGGGG